MSETGNEQLSEQRDFLLASLRDLDRERAVGDVDDRDYEALKADYTARAATVLRAIEAGRPPTRPPRERSSRNRILAFAAVVVFAGLAGVLVAQTVGRRDPGQFGSGDIRRSVTEKLNLAGQRLSEGDDDAAIELYDEVLEVQPTNAEALSYKGWALYTLAGDPQAALTSLLDAATANPDYPDAHAFLAVVFFRSGLLEQAEQELERLDSLDPSPDVRRLMEGVREQLDTALASTTTAP